ncbi:hypothetical protein HK100_000151 [Physocladia obscura]|uniref:Uncharacterized protein n=1 Tax=Physocladia obscura TaxID=109957 RepID=A0AAD5T1D6_9FUNG|nr:hypothetical protein HK100_000151 [Physocladia obscura]
MLDKSSSEFHLFVDFNSKLQNIHDAVSLKNWFQIYPSVELSKDESHTSLKELHDLSDIIVSPLNDFLDVIDIEEWAWKIEHGVTSFKSLQGRISTVFMNNVDESVECSSYHDSLDWPEWTFKNLASSSASVELSPVFGSEFSDVCIYSPKVDHKLIASKINFGENTEENNEDQEQTSDLTDYQQMLLSRTSQRSVKHLWESIKEIATILLLDPTIDAADLLIVRKSGTNSLFPPSFTNTLLSNTFLFPHKDIYTLVRQILHPQTQPYKPVLAVRWNMSPKFLSHEAVRICSSSLLKQVKKVLKTQNWNSGAFESVDEIFLTNPTNQEPQQEALVYFSSSLFPDHYDAYTVFEKPAKSGFAESINYGMSSLPPHLLHAYWFLRKRVPGYIDLSFLFELRDLNNFNGIFWKLLETALFEEADIAMLGLVIDTGCNVDDSEMNEGSFVMKIKERRKLRSAIIYPDLGEEDTDATRDSEGRKIVYKTVFWK